MTSEQFVNIMALVETDNTPNAMGDHGQAFSRWQVHPCFLWDQTGDDAQKPTEHETWDAWVKRLVIAFFNAHYNLPPLELAMYFHIGHRTLRDSDEWDVPYAARFLKYRDQVMP